MTVKDWNKVIKVIVQFLNKPSEQINTTVSFDNFTQKF